MGVDRNEDGMTLVELIVAFLIVGIILTPLVSSFLVGLANTERAQQRSTDTADQQVLASYFSNDVQSADDVGTTSTCGSGSVVLQLHWTDPVGSVSKTVAYSVTGSELDRSYCDSTGLNKTTPVVHALSSTPTVKCDGAACPASGGTPRTVAMSLSLAGDPNAVSHETYAFNLSATRRVN